MSLPPAQQGILAPPEFRDGVDGRREMVKLVNWLRRRALASSSGIGAALFSTAIGRGDVLATTTSGAELVGLPFLLPAVYPSFTLSFGGQVEDTASNGIFRVRLGGTFGLTDGTEVCRITATSAGYVYHSVQQLVTSNVETLVQMTLQSTPGNTARFRGGFIVGS